MKNIFEYRVLKRNEKFLPQYRQKRSLFNWFDWKFVIQYSDGKFDTYITELAWNTSRLNNSLDESVSILKNFYKKELIEVPIEEYYIPNLEVEL